MFHFRIHGNRDYRFKSYPLRYALKTNTQYLTTVKLPGSFRLAAGKQHLHCYCIFTGHLVETVFNSLGHSCGPELTRQGITLPLDDYSYRRRSLVLHSVSSKSCDLPPPNLTFQHWSGLTPYTSSYELARSCVFDKQSVEVRLLQPPLGWQAILRTYGHLFAEFLNEVSPVHLSILTLVHLCRFAVRFLYSI